MNNENLLLKNALLYENGHKRRTEHILKVYALAAAIAESEAKTLSLSDITIIRAAAILHDIAIKRCKELYNDANQQLQQKEATVLIPSMLKNADYDLSLHDSILFLVQNHHNYKNISDIRLQILIEADLLINFMEEPYFLSEHPKLSNIFKTDYALNLKNVFIK